MYYFSPHVYPPYDKDDPKWFKKIKEEGTDWSNEKIFGMWLSITIMVGFIATFAVSVLFYVYIEKPAIDARKIYQNKYAKKCDIESKRYKND